MYCWILKFAILWIVKKKQLSVHKILLSHAIRFWLVKKFKREVSAESFIEIDCKNVGPTPAES